MITCSLIYFHTSFILNVKFYSANSIILWAVTSVSLSTLSQSSHPPEKHRDQPTTFPLAPFDAFGHVSPRQLVCVAAYMHHISSLRVEGDYTSLNLDRFHPFPFKISTTIPQEINLFRHLLPTSNLSHSLYSSCVTSFPFFQCYFSFIVHLNVFLFLYLFWHVPASIRLHKHLVSASSPISYMRNTHRAEHLQPCALFIAGLNSKVQEK
jgi:hypothetical protein